MSSLTQWPTFFRGILITCGDVEENPGPVSGATKQLLPADADVDHDLANPSPPPGPNAAAVPAPQGHLVDLSLLPASAMLLPDAAPVSVLELLGRRVSVIRHIPNRMLRHFTRALTRMVDQYCKSPSDVTLFGVLALPKLCRCSVPVKGKFSGTDLE